MDVLSLGSQAGTQLDMATSLTTVLGISSDTFIKFLLCLLYFQRLAVRTLWECHCGRQAVSLLPWKDPASRANLYAQVLTGVDPCIPLPTAVAP